MWPCPHCGRPMRAGGLECEYPCRQSREALEQEQVPPVSLVTGFGQRRSPREQKPHSGIEGLRHFRNRRSIDELPEPFRSRARQWLNHLVTQARKRGRRVEGWYLAILCGQAKRLAKNPPDSTWGRSMRAKKGGYAVQQRYRQEGRNPTARATHMSRRIRAYKKRKAAEAEERARLGLPEPSRHGFTQGNNPFWG